MKKKILKFSLGIDVSKDKLDCNLSYINELQEVKTKARRTFNNTSSGTRDLIVWFKRHWKEVAPLVVVMEVDLQQKSGQIVKQHLIIDLNYILLVLNIPNRNVFFFYCTIFQ